MVRNMCYFVINIIFLISQLSIGTEGESGKLKDFANVDGSHKDFAYMLKLRENQVYYVQLLDTYAPCIVSNKVWNNDRLMSQYCGSDQLAFHEHILTISDEAFLLLVLINYAARWKAELNIEHKKVSQQLFIFCHCKQKIHTHRTSNDSSQKHTPKKRKLRCR